MSKRIIPLFLSVVILFSVFTPISVSADYTNSRENVSYWEGFLIRGVKGTSGTEWGGLIQGLAGKICGDICRTSDDSLHHADSIKGCKTGSDDKGMYALAKCKYCGQSFKYYSDDLKQQYNDAVSGLPARGFKSDGSLLLKVPYSCIRMSPRKNYSDPAQYVSFGTDWAPGTMSTSSIESYYGVPVDLTAGFGAVSCTFGDKENHTMYWRYYFSDFRAPISGYYQGVEVPYSFSYISADGSGSFPFLISKYQNSTYLGKNALLISQGAFTGFECTAIKFHSTPFSAYVFSVIPDTLDEDYSPSGRVGSFNIDLTYTTNNNITNKVENTTIVNETNHTVYNPVTNTTTNITDWTYDYSDRSYTVTTDNSTTQTITYGDEYVTIKEGDTIYNIYYYVAQDQNPDQDTGCKHSYTSAVTTAATCEAPGLMTYTCSKCGDTYTEKIPATGHTWQVKRTVKTEYDEAGNVTQQGYTVYKCAICGTEYKDDAGTGPPSTPDNGDSGSGGIWDKLGNLMGSVVAGILSLIEAVFGKLLDSMISLAEMIAGKLKQVVELVLSFFDEIPTLFGGFLGFLSAVFPFIPDDIMLLLTFGLAAVVFIGIIKALRR